MNKLKDWSHEELLKLLRDGGESKMMAKFGDVLSLEELRGLVGFLKGVGWGK